MELDVAEENKKHRKRTKRLLNSIQQQLDFYFSDANLHHDRYLHNEISESSDGYIPLSTMLKCNKLKALGTEVAMLAKAVENSKTLKLNEDGTKVKRLVAIPKVKNTDAQTVYVEQLHGYHDHEYLKQIFSTCGTVDYISLPRYKHNNQIKGFAFIEFSHPTEADKAVRVLNTAAPSKNKNKKRLSIDKSQEVIKQEDTLHVKRKRRRSTSFSESSNTETKKKHSSQSVVVKRQRSVSESSDGSPVKLRKKQKSTEDRSVVANLSLIKDKASKDFVCDLNNPKTDSSDAKRVADYENDNSTVKKTKTDKASSVDTLESTDVAIDEGDGEESKKKKKRKHPKKNTEVKEIIVPPLYVIPKSEWLSMKKQYKDLQRKKQSELKQYMRVLKSEKVRRMELMERIQETLKDKHQPTTEGNNKEFSDENKDKFSSASKLNVEVASGIQNTVNDRYQMLEGNSKDISCQNKENTSSSSRSTPNVEMISGTVVLLKTTCEKLNRTNIKTILSQYADIAYVDYLDGCPRGHIRFKGADSVEKIFSLDETASGSWDFKLHKLTDEEEREYFEKAAEDRRKKYEQNQRKDKRRKERGMQKTLKVADQLML